jgi:HAD superfamily hydrolase (TIGR01484 family)
VGPLIRLVALDIDGTVVPHGATVPGERVTAAVRALANSGVAVVLASGRMFPGTAVIHRHLGLRTPLICQQGCGIHLPDGTMIHEFPIARDVALEMVHYAREQQFPFEWFNPIRYLVSERTEQSETYGRLSGITPEYLARPELTNVIPTGVGVISTEEDARAVHRHLVGLHPDRAHVLDFPAVTVAVAPEANKARALELLCNDLGIDRHETVAVGDSVNDAPMLAWSPNSYAMAASDAYARDAASNVLDADADALARLLESLA